MSETPVGAAGPVDNGADNPSNSNIENFVNNMGDAAFFDAFQSSGNLHNLRGNRGTRIVFPDTMHNDPQYGHILHFDIFYKKSPKMEDVTNGIKSLFGGDTVRNELGTVVGDISNGMDIGDVGSGYIPAIPGQAENVVNFISNGSANDQTDGLLGGLLQGALGSVFGGLFGVFGDGIPDIRGLDTSDLGALGSVISNDPVVEDTRLGKATEESLDKVTLYMPRGIKTDDSINYAEHDFGLIKGALEGNLAALLPGMAAKAADFVDGLAEITGTEVNSGEAIQAITGAVRNPRKEQLFEGVDTRTFSFAFNLFPKSKKESHDLMEMIKLFRFHAYPEIVPNQAFYNFPSEFQITFIDLSYQNNNPFISGMVDGVVAKENQWLTKIGRCVLTNVGVDYFPMDSMSTFGDGAPTAITLTLEFSEMQAISRNHVKQGY